jgi:hypothetical protein
MRGQTNILRNMREESYWETEEGLRRESERLERERPKTLQFRLKRYGLSIEEYTKLFEGQNGCCKICGRHETKMKRPLCIDHCHKTGEVRALLCNKCNQIVGLVETGNLPAVERYLQSFYRMRRENTK